MIMLPACRISVEYLTWYLSMNNSQFINSSDNVMKHFYMLDDITNTMARLSSSEKGSKERQEQSSDIALHYAKKFEELYRMFNERGGRK